MPPPVASVIPRRAPRRPGAGHLRGAELGHLAGGADVAGGGGDRRQALGMSLTSTEATAARIDLLASDFARRMAPSTSAATARTWGSASGPAAARRSSASGQGERCTEPSCHHDHTSSVTKGRNGANSRSSVDRASAQRGPGRSRPAAPVAVRPALDQLEVVVAERPEERLGALEGPGVVVRLERRGGAATTTSASRAEHGLVERLADRPTRRRSSRRRGPARTCEALSILIASRRPTFIWPSSKAASVPGAPRPPSSAPRRSRAPRASPSGVTTLPLDLDIFLRSGSRIQPEMAACRPRQRAVLEVDAARSRTATCG